MKKPKFFVVVSGQKWWWFSLAFAGVGLILAQYIYISNLSSWLSRPSTIATLGSSLMAIVCVGLFIAMSARRAQEIGSSPKFLLTCFFVIPIPFWIYVLGYLPTKTNEDPFPIKVPLRNLKFALSIVLLVSAVGLALYYLIERQDTLGSTSLSTSDDDTENSQNRVPSFSDCYNNGIAYYKKIASYPRLRSTGERVSDVVAERCQQSRLAFGS